MGKQEIQRAHHNFVQTCTGEPDGVYSVRVIAVDDDVLPEGIKTSRFPGVKLAPPTKCSITEHKTRMPKLCMMYIIIPEMHK